MHSLPARPRVIAGLSEWSLNGPTVLGGRLMQDLQRLGWDTRVLLTESDTANVTVRSTVLPRPEGVRFDRLPAAPHDGWGMRWNALIRYLEEHAPCIYLMSSDWRNNVVAPRLSNRVKLVGFIHADHELEFEQVGRLGTSWNRIVAVDEVLQFKAAHRFPEISSRLVTIPNGVLLPDAGRPPRSGGPIAIVYVGELRTGQKRLDDVVAIGQGLAADGVPFRLTFLGDGPGREGIEQRLAPLMADRVVRITGALSESKVRSELATHDVVILASEYEGLSLGLLEAMAFGCVPVVSELPAHTKLIANGVNGFTLPVGDVRGFIDRLAHLAGDPELLERTGDAAAETVRRRGLTSERMVAAYEQLLDQLSDESERSRFRRTPQRMALPPETVAGVPVLPRGPRMDDFELPLVNDQPWWPDGPVAPVAARSQPRRPTDASRPVDACSVVIANPMTGISGVDVFTRQLSSGLAARGFRTRLVTEEREPGAGALGLADEGVQLDTLDLAAFDTWRSRWRKMAAYLAAHAPCVYLPNYDYEYSAVIPRLPAEVRVVTIAHSDDPAYYDLVMRVGAASEAIVGVSEAVVAQIGRLAPELRSRAVVIPYGVDAPAIRSDPPAQPSEPLRILLAGRVVEYQKRCRDALAIARSLLHRGVEFELTVAGDGDARPRVLDEARPLLLSRHMRFLGTVPHDEMTRVFAQSDALVLPSAFEGLPISLLEAMGHGLVPVVSDLRSGIPDVIAPGRNGLVAPVGDIERFADHLERLHRDRRLLGELSARARQTVTTSFRLEAMLDRYAELVQTVVDGPPASRSGRLTPHPEQVAELDPRIAFRRWLGSRARTLRQRLG